LFQAIKFCFHFGFDGVWDRSGLVEFWCSVWIGLKFSESSLDASRFILENSRMPFQNLLVGNNLEKARPVQSEVL
jgi:hypothetical protein